jgi:hypothetical protein
MLSKEENELLTRVHPGTPMGRLFRRYWIPALLSEEIPDADGPPVRVPVCSARISSLFVTRRERSASWTSIVPIAALHCFTDATRSVV